jgi:hypothetical protein
MCCFAANEVEVMRIVLTCLQALRPHAVSAYKHWEIYFKRGIEEAAHEWVEVPGVDWVEPLAFQDDTLMARWREVAWSRTVEFIRREQQREPIHLFLGYLYPHMVERSAIQDIKSLGIPCVNFFCDNVREFRKVPPEYRCFDLHWVPEYQALGMYRKAGLKHIHAAMPCWVPPEQRKSQHPESEGATFIGSPDELRRQLLGKAIELGIDISIYGTGWRSDCAPPKAREKTFGQYFKNQWQHIRQHGFDSWLLKLACRFRPLPQPPAIPAERLRGKLSPDDFVRVMQQSTITLGINRVHTHGRSSRNPITYSRLRDIEAPMMGSCYVTEWAEDLEHLYELGVEIETYRTAEELAEVLRALQNDAQKRRRMRRLGQARALSEHTVPRTLKRIVDLIIA